MIAAPSQTDLAVQVSQLAIKATGIAGHYWYASLDAGTIRHFVDGAFPGLAKDIIADCASGQGHRWRAGHDLLVDVLPRVTSEPGGAIHQAGHILLTDFPTKAGIPIPGLSANGIGQQLVEWGIPKGYLSLNIADSAIGIMAVSESHADLLSAMNGGTLDAWSAFDTFAEGGMELYAGVCTENPLLIAAGIEDIAAGAIRTYNTIELALDEMFVTVEEFFGASLAGSLVGMGISLFLSRHQPTAQRVQKAILAGGKAALLGGASAISPFLSLGLAAGFCFYEISKAIIDRKVVVREYLPGIYKVTLESCMESPSFREAWQAYETSQKLIEQLTTQHEREITTRLDSIRKGMENLLANIEQNLPSVDVSLPSTIVENKDSKIEDLIENQQLNIEKLISTHP